MILSESEDFIFSSLGWVDGGTVWVLDTIAGKATSVHIGKARFVTLHKGQNNHFSVAHNYNDDKFEVSVHRADRMMTEVGRFAVSSGGIQFTNDIGPWSNVPKYYISYFDYEGIKDYWLCCLTPQSGDATLIRFDWYDDKYDKGYQGVVGVVEVPDSELVLVSIQRDSSPVLFQPNEQRVVQLVRLDDRRGNPKLQFNRDGTDLWADDYDTVLKLDRKTWSVKNKAQVQEDNNGTKSFIGTYWLNCDETFCVVPRPFSGDIVALDVETFRIKYRCQTGRQPLEAVMLKDNRVFGRDWKSGEPLTGKMERQVRLPFFK
jgi:hypothetical protein